MDSVLFLRLVVRASLFIFTSTTKNPSALSHRLEKVPQKFHRRICKGYILVDT